MVGTGACFFMGAQFLFVHLVHIKHDFYVWGEPGEALDYVY